VEVFVVLMGALGGVFLVYGLLVRAGLIDETPCGCAACVRARRDVTRGW
jgi:hypothetical protein